MTTTELRWSESAEDLRIILSERQWGEWAAHTPTLAVWTITYAAPYSNGEAIAPAKIVCLTDDVKGAIVFDSQNEDYRKRAWHVSQPETHHWDTRSGKFAHVYLGRVKFEQFPDLPAGYGMTDKDPDQEGVLLVFAQVRLHVLSRQESRDLLVKIAKATTAEADPRSNGHRWAAEFLAEVSGE